jgi:hypothetical protein
MNNKLIIMLIAQDMKYHRFIDMIYKESGIPDEYEINLLEIVALSMDIKQGKIPDNWIDTYMEFIHLSFEIKIEELISYAETAYNKLSEISAFKLYE